ncbi:MAG TPA: hypothetical protein VFT06_05800, partial [Flavisolibacter sp.]|nr:hypothetical protein [Flavisolibacter sp.]
PNREVKPLMANGTAPQCGRVGNRHIHYKKPLPEMDRGFCIYINEIQKKGMTEDNFLRLQFECHSVSWLDFK